MGKGWGWSEGVHAYRGGAGGAIADRDLLKSDFCAGLRKAFFSWQGAGPRDDDRGAVSLCDKRVESFSYHRHRVLGRGRLPAPADPRAKNAFPGRTPYPQSRPGAVTTGGPPPPYPLWGPRSTGSRVNQGVERPQVLSMTPGSVTVATLDGIVYWAEKESPTR